MIGARPKLGLALQNAAMGGNPMFPQSFAPDGQGVPIPALQTALATDTAPKGGFFKDGGMGRYLAGAIGDVLLQQSGMQPMFAPMQRQKQSDEREEAQWTRRREAENQDWTNREAWKLANQKREPTSMERNLATFQQWGPDQRKAYAEMQQAERGDPFVTTTLPNGQFYAGPQSGLIGALTGAAPQTAQPRRLGPVVDTVPGGAGGNASGGFPR